MAKKRTTIDTTPATQPLSSLGDLLRQRGVAAATRHTVEPAAAPPAIVADGQPDLSHSGKLVLRRERKGHGGKTVTAIDAPPLSPSQLEAVARHLRKALGCGARVDQGRVIVQGDLIDPVERWLKAQGARQVVRGN